MSKFAQTYFLVVVGSPLNRHRPLVLANVLGPRSRASQRSASPVRGDHAGAEHAQREALQLYAAAPGLARCDSWELWAWKGVGFSFIAKKSMDGVM